MQDCKPAMTPMEPRLKLSFQSASPLMDETLFRRLVGSLIYLTTTRPRISFAVHFMSAPKADHWIAMKRVLRYGVLKLAKNPVFHERTKHVETRCHYIRQLVEDESIQLRYVPTTEQRANIFTKPLGPDKFVKFRRSIGVVNRLSIKEGY
eukprot:PITA_02199